MYTNVELSIGIKADISSKVQIAENLGIKAIQHWKFLYEAYPLRRKLKLSQGKSKVTLKVYKSFTFLRTDTWTCIFKLFLAKNLLYWNSDLAR